MKDLNNSKGAYNTPKAPEPEEDMGHEEYQFHLGMYRIKSLNNLIEACSRKYHQAILKKDSKNVYEYQSIVNTLFTETYVYIENNTNVEKLGVEQDKDNLYEVLDENNLEQMTEEELLNHTKKIRNIYLAIRGVLKKVKIDIPRDEKLDDTEIFTQT